jgi:hypothetical protein
MPRTGCGVDAIDLETPQDLLEEVPSEQLEHRRDDLRLHVVLDASQAAWSRSAWSTERADTRGQRIERTTIPLTASSSGPRRLADRRGRVPPAVPVDGSGGFRGFRWQRDLIEPQSPGLPVWPGELEIPVGSDVRRRECHRSRQAARARAGMGCGGRGRSRRMLQRDQAWETRLMPAHRSCGIACEISGELRRCSPLTAEATV